MTNGMPKWIEDLIGWYSISMFAIGARTGLLDAMLEGPGTLADVSSRAGVDERNAFEWLRAMVASGHVAVEGERYSLTPETTFVFGPGFAVNARAIVDFADRSGAVARDVAEAIRSGRGVAPARFHEAYGDAIGRINSPTYAASLVTEWINLSAGLAGALVAGAKIADLASGNGDAVLLMARTFSDAEVTAYDLDQRLVAATMARAGAEGLANVRGATGTDGLAPGAYRLVTCLDSFHHLGDPTGAARRVREALVPGGVFLVAETATSGELAADARSPFSTIVYASGLLYCLQENLANGGAGITGGDGPGWALDALAGAGFASVEAHDTASGYRVFIAEKG
jgi:2-polyprenyl-3-methyl-5-hydroxy-6-metoxy-1,4-benzoquinol methylase